MTASGRPTLRRTAELLFKEKGIDFRSWLAGQFDAGTSPEEIAHELYMETDREISVSYRTVYRWAKELNLEAVS